MTEILIGNDSELTSIASGINAAKPGDVITIYPLDNGMSYPAVAVKVKTPGLTIRGAVGSPVILNGFGYNYSGSGNVPRAIFQFHEEAEGAVIENLNFDDARNKSVNAAGIRLIGTKDVTIRNCIFTGNDNGLFASGEISDLKVVDTKFLMNGRNAQSHNVYLSGGTSASFFNCDFIGTIGGQNLKSRVRSLSVLACRIEDSKNRELDLVDGITTDRCEVVISGCKIVKRRSVFQGGKYIYLVDPDKWIANQHVIQFGIDSKHEYPVNGTLYLLNNTIVTPYKYPIVTLSSPGANLVMVGNTVIRPEGVKGNGTQQCICVVNAGELIDRARGWENTIPDNFIDKDNYV